MNKTLIAIAAGAATAGAASAQVVLDGFDAIPNDDAGGSRVLTNDIDNPNNFPIDIGINVTFDGGNGTFFFFTPSSTSVISSIAYTPAGGLDAAALGVVGLEFDFRGVDQSFDVGVEFADGGGNLATGGFSVASGDSTVFVPLGGLSFDPGFDATNITLFTADFNSSRVEGLDFLLTEIRAVVPSPGTAAVLGLGGLAALRRRR